MGRSAEAEAALREVADELPDDATVHLNLGLIALKLERFASAVESLGRASALKPDDRRAFGYLGYAYARLGDRERAADAFRRAGQEVLAAEVESALPGEVAASVPAGSGPAPPEIRDEFAGARTAVTHVEAPERAAPRRPPAPAQVDVDLGPRRAGREPARPVSLDAFALERLVAVDEAAPLGAWQAEGLALRVDEELYARADVLAVVEGELRLRPAHCRARGRVTDRPLGEGEAQFCLCVGSGEAWLSPARPGGTLLELALDDDVLYLRQDVVAAFGGELVWEVGSVPRVDLRLMQFRGSGHVVVELDRRDVIAVRTTEERVLRVDRRRLLGWIGRVVARGLPEHEGLGTSTHVACEGEGVLLVSKHGQARKRVHERAEPRDHGPGAAGPGGAPLHR
jgi:tetratricopeptide (TPR) repeat protein